MIDVSHQLSAVQRTVGARVLEAGEARVLRISQTYGATVEDVWDACTNPERLPRWFMPVSGDLRLGGRYQIEGNASGVVERCDPPTGFAATWEFGGEVSWIDVALSSTLGRHPPAARAHRRTSTTSGGRSTAPARWAWVGI